MHEYNGLFALVYEKTHPQGSLFNLDEGITISLSILL